MKERFSKVLGYSLLLGLTLLYSSISLAYSPGTSALPFLKIGVGARPAGMGEAFSSISNDGNALFWNPAGLSQIEGFELTAMHLEWLEGIFYEALGIAFPYPGGRWVRETIGLGLVWLHTTDVYRNASGGIGDEFEVGDRGIFLGYGRMLSSRLSSGVVIKYIEETLEEEKADVLGFDAGILWKYETLSLGFVIQNIGPEIKFLEESDSLPLTHRVGASLEVWKKRLLLSLELVKFRDSEVRTNLGTEFYLMPGFSLRGGYRWGYDEGGGFSWGFGIKIKDYSFDYAFVPYGDLGNSHRFSLGVNFGGRGLGW